MLERTIRSPKTWDRLLAVRGRDAAFSAELERLPASAVRAARLAQLHLVSGRTDYALQALAHSPEHPLVQATRLSVHSAQHEYSTVIASTDELEFAPLPESLLLQESRARLLQVRATALWGERRFEEAARIARRAMRIAADCGMHHFASICEMLNSDCQALRLEVNPAQREAELRELLQNHAAAEGRIEALINLVQLMYRQGRYEESMRLSQEIPPGRQGRFFQTISLIANRFGDAVNWAQLPEGLDFGRLRAVHGLLQLDADFILAGPAPRDEAPLTQRHIAEWQLAFAWAHMRQQHWQSAMDLLDAPFIHRTEWDLRLIRSATWLELLVAVPDRAWQRCNALATLKDAARLLREYIAPKSVLVQMLPRAAPRAVALLAATPEGCAVLTDQAQRDLVVLDGRGLSANGLTRTQADSMQRLAQGESLESPQATRAARYRLKRLLQQQRQALVVKAQDVLRALNLIAAEVGLEGQASWRHSAETYCTAHALHPD